MADSRIKDASETVASGDLAALLNSLYFAVDATGFTDFKKILLKTILTEAVVTANTNNYQAMTPKAFYDSVMSTTVKGIGQLATDAEVTAKTGTGLLNSVHQVLMQAQWKQDFFKATNGLPPMSLVSDTGDLSTAKAIAYQTVWAGDMSAYGSECILNPTLPANKAIKKAYVHLALHVGTLTTKGSFDLVAPAYDVQQNTAMTGLSGMNVYIWDRGRVMGIQSTSVRTDVRVSATVNATLWEI